MKYPADVETPWLRRLYILALIAVSPVVAALAATATIGDFYIDVYQQARGNW